MMTLICNVKVQTQATMSGDSSGDSWEFTINESERYIESGSAYFAQAFAEALSLISDLEVHNPERAGLRLQSMAFLLEHALKQYETSMEFGSRTSLDEYHERKLREVGLSFEGVRQVLSEAQSRRFLRLDDEQFETIAATFDQMGYRSLMDFYTAKVREIHDLTVTIGGSNEPGDGSVGWQELAWKLTTLFAQTLEVGKAIAILNTLTFRLLSDASFRFEPLKLNT
jgi:hypothetical protein